MARPSFTGNLTQQPPIPDEGIAAAVELMRSGRLHRYNVAPGEVSQAAELEREYAAWQGARYCLAVTSGGQAMQIALRAAGAGAADLVLTNGFTLAPVPGAIAAVGARPVLVETTPDLAIDLDDLASKARASGARFLLLSNMRGHLCDMDRLMRIAAAEGFAVIEDCAHTMGARWNGKRSGSFGLAGCFSTQTYKHLNSGEGGFLVSDDAELMARATIMSGSYMLYERHGAGPDLGAYGDARLDSPNMSARMDNLRAAILRPQLRAIETAIAGWNARHDRIAGILGTCQAIRLPRRPAPETYVGSSIQFFLDGLDSAAATGFVAALAGVGVEVKWFGAAEPAGFTSTHKSWRYVAAQDLPQTDALLSCLFDMRIPLTLSLGDCDLIASHITDAAGAIGTGGAV